jgi:hypothetical protein
MSQFLILIYESEQAWLDADPATEQAIYDAHSAFNAKYRERIVNTRPLEPVAKGRVVRPDGAGGFTVTDGPFAESKEALGGYYLVEAADLDEAVAMSREIPMQFGAVEVRPVMVIDR